MMHDLIHDLAQFISEGEFCMIDDDESKEIPNTIRHLSATLTDKTKLMEFSCYEKLRTLMINYKSHWHDIGVEGSLFLQFERLKNIRVLILQRCGLRELPETIGGSIHLRYLDISHNFYFRRLPESLCGLYNLRVLDLWGCELQSFPHGMSKLINLMHLNAEDKIISEINDVGKLTSLQGLCSFKVLKDKGHEVAQLGSLKYLHGELRITSLENVESQQEANKANLNNKQYLGALALEWTSDDGSSLDGNELVGSEEVLEGLQPHQALQRLMIVGYIGVRSPSWLQAQLLANLRTLRLINCKAWKDLSYIGQLPNLKKLYVKGMPAVKQISHGLSTESKFLPNLEELVLENMVALEELPCLGQLSCLKVLHIEGMSAVTKVGHGFFGYRDQGKCFPCLEELRFSGMPKWEEWSWADGRELFPCLRNLGIEICPRLKRMPPLPPSLESLSLWQVGLTEVPGSWEEIDGSSSSMTVSELKIYSLEKVELMDIPECERLPCLGQLPRLKVIHIKKMPAVKKVGYEFFGSRDHCFPSLEELTFTDMPEWEEWSWADGRELFPCLRELGIVQCPRLKKLTPLPSPLKTLRLFEIGLTEVPGLCEGTDGSSSSLTACFSEFSLEKVELMDMVTLEELPSLGQLPSLKVLRIERMPAVKKVGYGFFGSRDQGKCFPSLEVLKFRDMPQWEEWSWANGGQLFPCLRELEIVRCPRLKRMPPLPPLETLSLDEVGLTEVAGLREGIHGGGSCVTASLSSVEISQCPNLRNLEEGLLSHSFQNIVDIAILECAELVWLPVKEFKELTSLEKLSIRSCPKLLSMTRDEDIYICLPPSIEELVLSDCGDLGKLLPGCLHNLTSLTRLEIGGCPSIESLPETSLLHLKRLEYLKIWKCGELRSIDGLRVLESLRELTTKLCPKLLLNEGNKQVEGSTVTELCIDDTALFKLSLLRRTLPSVHALTISNFPRATMSGEEEQLLRSLTALRSLEFFNCENLQSLPRELHALSSLRLLKIIRCPKIQVLPEKGLPTSLRNLIFSDCHRMLREQLEKHLAEMKSSG
ncbi:putative disease resistance protein At3g14460 [Musa acuminata AAA Group]|uniref:putative disease resistance protein At3g14460 n=1 Tax=Musa acuminata AAA Group TaxID=214697 RepID=UPI0031D0235B